MQINQFNTHIAPILNQHAHNRNQFNFPKLTPQIEDTNNLFGMDETFIQRGMSSGNFTAVEYVSGKIVYYPKIRGVLGISFEFTGCMMAQFKYRNMDYIAHISLPEAREAWNDFIIRIHNRTDQYKDFILFKPYCFPVKDIYEEAAKTSPQISISICGAVENNECFAGVMQMNNCTLTYAVRINYPKRVYGRLDSTNFRNVLI